MYGKKPNLRGDPPLAQIQLSAVLSRARRSSIIAYRLESTNLFPSASANMADVPQLSFYGWLDELHPARLQRLCGGHNVIAPEAD